MDPTIAGDGDIEVTRAQNRNFLLGDGFHRMAREANSFSLLLRYQAQAERHYRRAIEEFDRLKALREELPIEPITEPDLEPRKTTYPDPPTNPNSPGKTSLQACQAGEPPQSDVGRDVSVFCESLGNPKPADGSPVWVLGAIGSGNRDGLELGCPPFSPFPPLTPLSVRSRTS
jgi:hypothetical protein